MRPYRDTVRENTLKRELRKFRKGAIGLIIFIPRSLPRSTTIEDTKAVHNIVSPTAYVWRHK